MTVFTSYKCSLGRWCRNHAKCIDVLWHMNVSRFVNIHENAGTAQEPDASLIIGDAVNSIFGWHFAFYFGSAIALCRFLFLLTR